MDERTKNLDRLERVLSRKVGTEWVLRHASYLSVRPGTSEEVSDIMKIANRTRTPVFPKGRDRMVESHTAEARNPPDRYDSD